MEGRVEPRVSIVLSPWLSRQRAHFSGKAPARQGFWSRLIERQLPMEFDGEADIDFKPEGVGCRLAGPLLRLGWQGQDQVVAAE